MVPEKTCVIHTCVITTVLSTNIKTLRGVMMARQNGWRGGWG